MSKDALRGHARCGPECSLRRGPVSIIVLRQAAKEKKKKERIRRVLHR